MIIRPSAAIRQNYNEIAEQCRKTGEPVFLTKNGEGDLVVMDIEFCGRSRGHDAQRDPGGIKSWRSRVTTVSLCPSGQSRCWFPTLLF